MHISFAEQSIELRTWSDKSQMMKFLSGCEAGKLLLGENSQQEIEFYSATIYLDYSKLKRFGVGVCSEGHGLVPNLFLQPEISILVFGFNNNVVGVRIPNGEIIFTLKLDSVFYSFLPLYDLKIIIIQHEIGVIAIRQTGQVIWEFSSDIITNMVIMGDQLYIEFMDSPSVYLNLSNGTVIV